MSQDVDMQYVTNLETQLTQAQATNQQLVASNNSMFGTQNKPNLVEWQLDFKSELEDIEHLLRNDVLTRDVRGNESWTRNSDREAIVFNDRGVNDILRQIRMMLNKNKVLSNYDKAEIRERVRSIGHELRSFIYNNAESYGIDNEYKQNQYPIIVLTIISMIEDAYRRALNGEERRDLNQARVVNQTEPISSGMGMMPSYPQQRKKFSMIKPWTWGG